MPSTRKRPLLLTRLERKTASVGIVGLGYVGLPLALTLTQAGFHVVGVDINREKVQSLSQGKLPFAQREPGLRALLQKMNALGTCDFSDEFRRLRTLDAIIITVQTPLRGHLIPDYRILMPAIHSVSSVIKKAALLVVQSTVAPRTSRDQICPLVEKLTAFKIGRDLFYAHVPERVMPGAMLQTLQDLPRIIGADDDISRQAARLLYEPITRGHIDLTDTTTAETAKTAENAHRYAEIQFANALALTCERYGVSYQKVRNLANKRSNVHLLQPGSGVGGHCIPKDPWLLVAKHRKSLLRSLFLVGNAVNEFMVDHTVILVQRGLRKAHVQAKGAQVAVLGYSYREGSDDIRSTPTQGVVEKLHKVGIRCTIHDPLVSLYRRKKIEDVIHGKDAIVIVTAHQEYRDYPLSRIKQLLKHPIIIDGRQTWSRKEVVKHGFIHLQIGEPNEH